MKIVNSDYINNIIFIVLLLIVVLIVCFKSISIHNSIMENFEDSSEMGKMEKEMDDAMGKNDNQSMLNSLDELLDDLGVIYNKPEDDEDNEENEEDLAKKCANIDKGGIGSVTSKYSGKSFNVDALPPVKGSKRKYMIKWQPVGGKPGGCITANADGTYSTPICNANINKQQWFIKEVKNAEQYRKLIPKDRRKMGGDIEDAEYPFFVIQSSEYENYCLHYEGGGLAIREIANYNSQKWDVSKDKVTQDPLPTQDNNKYSALTPGHKMVEADKTLGSIGENGGVVNGGGSQPMQFNINVDPDLLNRLGVDTGLVGSGSSNSLGSNSSSQGLNFNQNGGRGMNNGREGDLLLTEEELRLRKLNKNKDNSDMMVDYNGNQELCEKCGDIPDNMIRKDLVKSMCIGCNNIDNVLE
jgi:hypothetical protein